MAFVLYPVKNVTSTATTLRVASATTTIIGLTLANTTVNEITMDVFITRSAVDYYLVKGAPIPPNGTLVAVGGSQKVVLNASDTLKAQSSAATSADALLSVLE